MMIKESADTTSNISSCFVQLVTFMLSNCIVRIPVDATDRNYILSFLARALISVVKIISTTEYPVDLNSVCWSKDNRRLVKVLFANHSM